MPPVKCAVCHNWKSRTECKSLSSATYVWFHDYLRSEGKKFNLDDLYFCKSCTGALYTMKENLTTAADSSSSESSLPDTMEIERNDDRLTFDNVFFTGSGHKRCVICRTPVSSQMIVMPKSARLDLLLIHRLFAPHGTRCCSSHLINGLRLLPNEYIKYGRSSTATNVAVTTRNARSFE